MVKRKTQGLFASCSVERSPREPAIRIWSSWRRSGLEIKSGNPVCQAVFKAVRLPEIFQRTNVGKNKEGN